MTNPTRPGPVDGAASSDANRELTLSREQLAVSTMRVPARRVRLEKYVVTETRTITVQVSHDEVRLVDLDPTTADRMNAEITPTGQDNGRWLTLSEERIVVTTEVVPIERVRLQVTPVTEQRQITETVQVEQVAHDPAAPRSKSST